MRYVSFYVPGDSLLHHLHPSTKLVLYGVGFLLIYLLPWTMRWVAATMLFVFMWGCGIPPTRYKAMALVTAIGSGTVPLIYGLWGAGPDDPLLLPLVGTFGFHEVGLTTGLDFAGLYIAIGVLTTAFLTTTRLWEMAEAPTLLGVSHTWGFAAAYAFSYMPEVVSRYLELTDVWKIRGVVFDKGSIWQKFWLQCRLLSSLLILEFMRVKGKSNAVEARGFAFERAKRPTLYILNPIPRAQIRLIYGAVAFCLISLVVKVSYLFFS